MPFAFLLEMLESSDKYLPDNKFFTSILAERFYHNFWNSEPAHCLNEVFLLISANKNKVINKSFAKFDDLS